MTTHEAPPGYDAKQPDYFQHSRPEMLPFVPVHCRHLLDVGCGEGGFGESLKRTREIEVWGIEPVKSAAAKARDRLDNVVEGVFGPDAALPVGKFDCILFNDVLEHMLTPEDALKYARSLLAPGGVVVASIPNIRNLPALWQLIVHASWEYMDFGIFDKTHLRFFTKSSIVNMFTREGYILDEVRGINAYMGFPNVRRRVWRAYRITSALSAGRLDDMKFLQFAVVARPASTVHGKQGNGED